MPFTPKTDDIRNYLEKRLHKGEPEAMDNDLRADMRIILMKLCPIRTEGNQDFRLTNNVYSPIILCRFRLVALNLDSILGEVTIGHRRVKLEHVVQGKAERCLYGNSGTAQCTEGTQNNGRDDGSDVGVVFGTAVTSRGALCSVML